MAHVTFIHGILNKPPAEELIRLWRQSLAEDGGLNLTTRGVTSSMVYWADVLYEEPLEEAAGNESLETVPDRADVDEVPTDWWLTLGGPERELVLSIARKLKYDAIADDDEAPPVAQAGATLERVPLPGWLKRRLMAALLRDVHHYLYDVEHSPRTGRSYRVRNEIRARFVAAVRQGGARPRPHVVVSHSMGTVIAYDCLLRVAECPGVDSLFTIGSPLGLDEIQDAMKPEWSRDDGYPSARVAERWVNAYDALDPVAGFDPELGNDYRRAGVTVVEDIHEPNWGRWRHDIAKYLHGARLRERLESSLS